MITLLMSLLTYSIICTISRSVLINYFLLSLWISFPASLHARPLLIVCQTVNLALFTLIQHKGASDCFIYMYSSALFCVSGTILRNPMIFPILLAKFVRWGQSGVHLGLTLHPHGNKIS